MMAAGEACAQAEPGKGGKSGLHNSMLWVGLESAVVCCNVSLDACTALSVEAHEA